MSDSRASNMEHDLMLLSLSLKVDKKLFRRFPDKINLQCEEDI
jgi:hypothetical protein